MSITVMKLFVGSVLFSIPQPGKFTPNLAFPSQVDLSCSQFVATLRTRHQSFLKSNKLLRFTVLVRYKGKYHLRYTNSVTVNAQNRKNALRKTNILGTPRNVLPPVTRI